MEESIPDEQAEVEEKINKLMEIEQADTLVIVIISNFTIKFYYKDKKLKIKITYKKLFYSK